MSDVAATLGSLFRDDLPLRLSAYDGSSAGDLDSPYELHVADRTGLAHLVHAPGDLGVARAYASGGLEVRGVHPGDPYPVVALLKDHLALSVPRPRVAADLVVELGELAWRAPAPPPEENPPRWRRVAEGVRHSLSRDADAIERHYDLSNRFYAAVLGESMTYSCALFSDPDDSLERAQRAKLDLICRKLALAPGDRLLDVGCGWGTLAIHAAREYGAHVLGVTLSAEQAAFARAALDGAGVADRVEIRVQDYREVRERDFDAVCSIGMVEHVGVRNYPGYFAHLRDLLCPGGRLLNHGITRRDNPRRGMAGAFIDRYVFPDGELTGSGTTIAAAQDAGLEVQHVENLRQHYALTLAAWNRNLVASWDECVAEVGEGRARIWGLYIAGSRIGFERGEIELAQVLATRGGQGGPAPFPLRPDWVA